jgi:TPR repeat protein
MAKEHQKTQWRHFGLNSQAAESGMRDAVLAMGWFYLNGVGVEQDPELARRWYRKSARQGDSRAMFSLGQMAYDEQDYVDALLWFGRVADKGHATSLFWIGKLLWRGDGAPEDRKRAMALFQKAATEKVPAAPPCSEISVATATALTQAPLVEGLSKVDD